MRGVFDSPRSFTRSTYTLLRAGAVAVVVLAAMGTSRVELPRGEGAVSSPPPGRVIHVRAEAEGTGDGTTWHDAYRDLDEALASAGADDEIRVAVGSYRPTDAGDREASFALVDGVRLLGGFAGTGPDPDVRDPALYPTILSGNIGDPDSSEDDSHHVLTAGPEVGPATVVDGFVVERGNAEAVQPRGGGGLYAAGQPTFRGCTFRRNRAVSGGGAYVDLGGALFLDCTFEENRASTGGAVYTRGGTTTLINVVASGNRAERGGAAALEFGFLALVNTTLTANLAEREGPALAVDGGTAMVHNSIVWGNLPADSPFAGLLPAVAFSDVEGGSPGEGNVRGDPQFRDPTGGDYRLQPASPSIDAGSDVLLPASVTLDRGGLRRRMPGRAGADPRVDQGAFEFDGSVAEESLSETAPGAATLLADSDADGVPDETDCRPLDGTVWAAPSPARDLLVEGKSPTTLSWRIPAAPGGTSVLYDVLRATSPSGFGSALCLGSDLGRTSFNDSAPAPAFFSYLVRAKNACGDSLGVDSSGHARTAPGCSATGQPCASDPGCTSGFCTDGYCCASRCGGTCESCSQPGLAGTCAAVPAGTDPADECPTDPASSCGRDGLCSGLRTCELWPSGTVCTPPGCASASEVSLADTCNGAGTCADGGVVDCTPYLCDPSQAACRTTCLPDGQCSFGDCCGPLCVDTSSDVANCGACGITCTNLHGSTSCSDGQCHPVCDEHWSSCDGDPYDGCETSLTTLTDCGACGQACSRPNGYASCETGTCQLAGCQSGYSNCDGNEANGCELNHQVYANTCGTATYLGGYEGDSLCGFICPAVPWTLITTTTGTTSKWLRFDALENSACVARIEHKIQLIPPAGTDYDLCVYTACGTPWQCSNLGGSAMDEVTIYREDDPWSEQDFPYWVEVKHFSGSSCAPWTLRFMGHTCD